MLLGKDFPYVSGSNSLCCYCFLVIYICNIWGLVVYRIMQVGFIQPKLFTLLTWFSLVTHCIQCNENFITSSSYTWPRTEWFFFGVVFMAFCFAWRQPSDVSVPLLTTYSCVLQLYLLHDSYSSFLNEKLKNIISQFSFYVRNLHVLAKTLNEKLKYIILQFSFYVRNLHVLVKTLNKKLKYIIFTLVSTCACRKRSTWL